MRGYCSQSHTGELSRLGVEKALDDGELAPSSRAVSPSSASQYWVEHDDF